MHSSALKHYQELFVNYVVFLEKRRAYIKTGTDKQGDTVRWLLDFDVVDESSLESLVFVRRDIAQKRNNMLARQCTAFSLLTYLMERQVCLARVAALSVIASRHTC